ncbi:hypothetical protein HPGAM_04320 [Helicobacter pylori Gambia94/24]|nr:hypothetical protein HPGAM_04320 [Helicobacter pylori Gambia94/24]
MYRFEILFYDKTHFFKVVGGILKTIPPTTHN